MLWILRFALCTCLALATAAEAHGESLQSTDGASAAWNAGIAATGKATVEAERRDAAIFLPRAGVAFVEPTVQAAIQLGDWRGLTVGGTRWRAGGVRRGVLNGLSANEHSGLRYSVSATVSLGFDYNLISEETLNFEVAETGSLKPDYNGHSIVLQARWEF